MLTALVPTTESVYTPEPDYKKLYEDACRDIEKVYEMYHALKLEHEELQAKHKETETVAMELTERNGRLSNAHHEMKCELIDLGERLLKAQSCIINMAMQLHGGDDDA